MIFCIANAKGGVSKTTTAMYLAAACVRTGRRVEVIDADPQASAYEWAHIARESGVDLGFEVTVGNRVTIRQQADTGKTVIIDTPPGSTEIMSAAVDVADLVIVPVIPGASDISRMWATLDGVAHGAPAAVLLTRYAKNEDLSYETRQLLTAESVPLFQTHIPRRTAIARSANGQIGELYGYDRVLKEIDEVLT